MLTTHDLIKSEILPHQRYLLGMAFRLTKDEEKAKDLLQDTLLKAIRFIDHYEPGTNAKAWITQVMRNQFLNDYCAQSKVRLLPLLGYPLEADSDRPEHLAVSSDLQQEITANVFSDEMSQALSSLSSDLRLIVLLTDVNDLSYDETAALLNIPLGTVRSRLSRGRNKLKQILLSNQSFQTTYRIRA